MGTRITCKQKINIIKQIYLDKNSQAVRKGVVLFKMVSVKKVVKSKLVAKK